jgi:hypothetical protein
VVWNQVITIAMEQQDLSVFQWPAVVLLAGGILFWIGALWPPYRQWMTSDTNEYLTIIGQHKLNWYIIHGAFLLGVIVTVAGIALFCHTLLLNGGQTTYTVLGATFFVFGSVFWIINIAFRLTVTVWAADQLTANGVLDDTFKTWMQWSGLLFSIYMVLAYASIGFIGLAARDFLPDWVSWFVIIFGFGGIVGYCTGFPLFAPPLMVHLPFMVMSISLLLAIKKLS